MSCYRDLEKKKNFTSSKYINIIFIAYGHWSERVTRIRT